MSITKKIRLFVLYDDVQWENIILAEQNFDC